HRFEDRARLDADRRQTVDVEEAAIVDLVGCHAPEAQAIALFAQKLLEAVKRARLSNRAVEIIDRFGESFCNLRVLGEQPAHSVADDLLLPIPLATGCAGRVTPRGQVSHRANDAL